MADEWRHGGDVTYTQKRQSDVLAVKGIRYNVDK